MREAIKFAVIILAFFTVTLSFVEVIIWMYPPHLEIKIELTENH